MSAQDGEHGQNLGLAFQVDHGLGPRLIDTGIQGENPRADGIGMDLARGQDLGQLGQQGRGKGHGDSWERDVIRAISLGSATGEVNAPAGRSGLGLNL